MWVWDKVVRGLVNREVTFVPGLYKIFDEILVNAADNKQRDPSMNKLRVTIDAESGTISVENNGRGIPVVEHREHKMWVPSLIFGHLLTSSNYDDSERKVTGGRNGYGAKLTNIFSTEFVVETCDTENGLSFRQVFRNNMTEKDDPEISPLDEDDACEDFTRITFTPDFPRFGMECMTEDVVALFTKRVYDMAGVTDRTLNVYLNGKRLPVRDFESYVRLHKSEKQVKAIKEGGGGEGGDGDGEEEVDDMPLLFERVNDRWEVCVTVSDGSFQQVSFVNSICTTKGGQHVTYVADQVADAVVKAASKKNKGVPLKTHHARNHLFVFVNSLIENPAFDSQTKETLTTRPRAFGSECVLGAKFLKQVLNSGVVDRVLSWAKFKQTAELRRVGGAKKATVLGIPKLDDANNAGSGAKARDCTLIVTEGDSAKALAISGLSVVGRDNYGVFPLRGKLLNVREATHKQIMANAEIQNVVKILGLQYGREYDSVAGLRYGHLLIMADQDHDGSHIKGLLINFLHHFWPSLLRIPGFLQMFITPIVKATPSRGGRGLSFFTVPEYESWLESVAGASRSVSASAASAAGDAATSGIRPGALRGWRVKYYKGLGTSTAAEAKEYFGDLDTHVIDLEYDDDASAASVLAEAAKIDDDDEEGGGAAASAATTTTTSEEPEIAMWRTPGKHRDSLPGKAVGVAAAAAAAVATKKKGWDEGGKKRPTLVDLGLKRSDIAGDLIDLAFSKKRADDRKVWLLTHRPGAHIDYAAPVVHVSDFVTKELILFSLADNERSIPSFVDGLKPSQRKVLFACFKRNLKREVKVAQLAGYVAEHSAYHHGEQSLAAAIVGMAQDFVGSNNINLLYPSGQFGTRLMGGRDAASPRYIFTRLCSIARAIFHPDDDALLRYEEDDGQRIEPQWFLPVIPMVLVNGADGIGTGWSTFVPNYNPRDVIANVRRMLKGERPKQMTPHWRGFDGSITAKEKSKGEDEDAEPSSFLVKGKLEIDDSGEVVTISELPIRKWTSDYKAFLETLTPEAEKQLEKAKGKGKKAGAKKTTAAKGKGKGKKAGAAKGKGKGKGKKKGDDEENGGEEDDEEFNPDEVDDEEDYDDEEEDGGKGRKKGGKKKKKDEEDEAMSGPLVKEIRENHTDTSVSFALRLTEQGRRLAENPAALRRRLKLSTTVSTTNMTLFDARGRIARYESATHILRAFFPLRRRYYSKRKEHMLSVLQEELRVLDGRVRFIRSVVDGELVVSRRSKSDIVAELHAKAFPEVLTASARAATSRKKRQSMALGGVESDDEDDEDEEIDGRGYNYLLSMPIYSLTKEKMLKLQEAAADKRAEVMDLEEQTPESLWERDLDALEAELDAMDVERAAALAQEARARRAAAGTTKGGRGRGKKGGKGKGKKGADAKAGAAKRKAAAAAARKAALKVSASSPSSSAAITLDSDDDFNADEVSFDSEASEEDSDFEAFAPSTTTTTTTTSRRTTTRRRGARGAAAKSAAKKTPSYDDEEEEEEGSVDASGALEDVATKRAKLQALLGGESDEEEEEEEEEEDGGSGAYEIGGKGFVLDMGDDDDDEEDEFAHLLSGGAFSTSLADRVRAKKGGDAEPKAVKKAAGGKKKKATTTTTKKKKAKVEEELDEFTDDANDEDEDFEFDAVLSPVKKAPKKAAKKAAPKKGKTAAPKKKASGKKKATTTTTTTTKTKTATKVGRKRAARAIEEDDDEEEEASFEGSSDSDVGPIVRNTPKPKRRRAKVVYVEEDEDEEEDFEEEEEEEDDDDFEFDE